MKALKVYYLWTHLKIKRVICVRHQATLIGTLQLETMSDPSIGCPIFPITTEFCKTFIISQFLKVFMICFYSTSAQIFHNTYNENKCTFCTVKYNTQRTTHN